MAWRFNAPPGWPVPPDFVPPQGWVPDPAWPPAPAGWTYWVEAPAPGPWGDPYFTGAPTSGAPAVYGVPAGYAGASGYGAAPPKRGLPGWAIGLIAAGVAFVVLSVLGVLVAGALVFAAISNGGFQETIAEAAASEACDQATSAVASPSTVPDPARVGLQARSLERALESADTAAVFDGQYESLRDDIEAAESSARRIAALPQDPATWSTGQQERAAQAQAEFNDSAERISRACSTIDDPFADDFAGPTI